MPTNLPPERRQYPFSNIEDTDWGRVQESRHAVIQQRFTTIEEQLKAIDSHISLDIRADEAIRKVIDERHRESAERFAALASKIGTVESEHIKLRQGLTTNTLLTESIKKDTASIILLTESLNVLRKFFTWAIPIATSLLSAYIAWTLKK